MELLPSEEDAISEALEQLHVDEALLVVAKTSFQLHRPDRHCWVLIDGPSAFYTLYTHPVAAQPRLHLHRAEQERWLREFKALSTAAFVGAVDELRAHRLVECILGAQTWEQETVYPAVARFLNVQRPTRELAYEHLGVERALPGLVDVLRGLGPPVGDLGLRRRAWERFELDCVHLLEHHLQHEHRGVFAVYERLANC